jgi:hypothetical protein
MKHAKTNKISDAPKQFPTTIFARKKPTMPEPKKEKIMRICNCNKKLREFKQRLFDPIGHHFQELQDMGCKMNGTEARGHLKSNYKS